MKLSELLEHCHQTQASDDGVNWYSPRPITMENTFLRYRIRAAWNVLLGRFDAIEWDKKTEKLNCWCRKCNENKMVNGIPFSLTRMILCPECGNKRCPKASNHILPCTNSNEPNQAGSVY